MQKVYLSEKEQDIECDKIEVVSQQICQTEFKDRVNTIYVLMRNCKTHSQQLHV